MDSLIHSVLNQTFRLLPQKAIFWEEKQTLILGDLHFGKATHFRKNGIALSQSIATNDFEKFTALLTSLNPKQVYFLGDLFHSEYNSEVFDLHEIIKANSSIRFVLIKGNHDIIKQNHLEKMGIQVITEWIEDSFIFTHEPTPKVGYYNIYGHLHPGVRLKGKAKQNLSLPCFYFAEHFAVLPAFSDFTGLKILENKPATAIYLVTDDKVIKAK